jgi:hypothetical protein
MSGISIALLERSEHADMTAALADMPPMADAEVLYVAPGDVQDLVEVPLAPSVWRLEYPRTMPPGTDAVLAARHATGELLTCWDARTPPRSWEVESIAQALGGAPDVVLTLHRPKGREAENVADVAAMALNAMLGQPHLAASSLFRLPYGFRRGVLRRVSAADLRRPPTFLLDCVLTGLTVDTFYRADVADTVSLDPRSLVEMHLEAIHTLLRRKGPRGGFTDFERRRTGWQTALGDVSQR